MRSGFTSFFLLICAALAPLAASATEAILVCHERPQGKGYRIELNNAGAVALDANFAETRFVHAEMAPNAQEYVLMKLNDPQESLELPVTSEETFIAHWSRAGAVTNLDCEILAGTLAGE